jgi:type I restriction enzyme S subunit
VSFREYDSYRNSGVEWLGDVPRHWTVERLKRLCDVRPSNVDKKTYDDEIPIRLCNYTDVYYCETISTGLELMEATATVDQIERFELRAGDVVITKDSETADDIAIAAYVSEDMPGVVCGYHLALVRPRSGTNGGFVKRYFDSLFAKANFAVRANGLTRVGLSQYALDNVDVPTPPAPEQAAIAAFLDRETAKIDALVEEQRRLIELLKEKRQSEVSHSVTRGLDPTASMKDSGVEWLGEVPEHWRVLTFGRVIERIEQGWSPSAHDRAPDPEEPSVLRLSAVKDGAFQPDQRKALPDLSDAELAAAPKLRAGDFLLTRANTPDLVGDCAISTNVQNTIFSDLIYRVTLRSNEALPEFVLLALRSTPLRAQIRRDARGSSMSMAKLSHGHVKSWWIVLPPVSEQRTIVERAKAARREAEALIGHAVGAIALLHERRTALISAAVTGTIDVRAKVIAAADAEAA